MGRRRILPFPSDRRDVDQLMREYDDPTPAGQAIDLDPLSGPLAPFTEDPAIDAEEAIDDAIDQLKKAKQSLNS